MENKMCTYQDELTGALIGLAKACDSNPKTDNTDKIIVEGLYKTITNNDFSDKDLIDMITAVKDEKKAVSPGCSFCSCPCGNTDDYDMNKLWNEQEEIRSLKSMILFSIRGMAAYAYHAMISGCSEDNVNAFLYKALCILGYEKTKTELTQIILEAGEVNRTCMELLDKANANTTGTANTVKASLNIEKGAFISPDILNCLIENFMISPAGTVEENK